MSNFSCIGLVAEDDDGLVGLMERVVHAAVDDLAGPGTSRHLRWTDASGASLGVHLDGEEIACLTPFFVPAEPARWRVRTSGPADDPDCAHCGGADCDVLDGGGELVTRTAVQWLHFQPYRSWLGEPRELDLHVVAFAHQLSFAATEEGFDAAQAEWFPREPGEQPFRLAAESFLPSGLFGDAEELDERARAIFAGRVEAVTHATNGLTEQPFLHVRVATLPGPVDVVASRWDGAPEVGAIALVAGWLVGRPELAPPRT